MTSFKSHFCFLRKERVTDYDGFAVCVDARSRVPSARRSCDRPHGARGRALPVRALLLVPFPRRNRAEPSRRRPRLPQQDRSARRPAETLVRRQKRSFRRRRLRSEAESPRRDRPRVGHWPATDSRASPCGRLRTRVGQTRPPGPAGALVP